MTQFDKYIGMVISDRYEIKELLGVGGMAVVFLAFDRVEKCNIALKMLKEEASTDETALECFESESRAISMLSHPNIRDIYDISLSGEHKYLTMEFLDGPTLKKYVNDKGPISQGQALDFIIQILDALDHTHSKGIVHRDIKPQNIIVTAGDQLKITDFGIAKLYDPHNSKPSDKGIGTVYYISPEQASGKNIDARGDIYSVGIILYELVCHRLPFVSDDPSEVAYMQISSEPTPPSELVDLPKGLEQIIMRAIAKKPDERFSDAGQMLAALRRFKETPEAVFDFVSIPADSRFYESSRAARGDVIVASPNDLEDTIQNVNPQEKTKKTKKQKIKKKKVVVVKTKTKSSHVSSVSIIFGALFACLLVAVMTVYYVYVNFISDAMSGNTDGAHTLVVEDFTNMECNDNFIQNMEKIGYSVTVIKQENTDYVMNTVISQNPKAGAKRNVIPGKKPCEITLYISSGETMKTLANYVGKPYKQVEIELEQIGFSTQVIKISDPAVPEGNIIRTFPEAGSYITADTRINIYVSTGLNISYVTMPSLSGKTASEIRSLLTKNGLSLEDVSYVYSDTIEAGQVVSQFPYAGAVVPKNITDISIIVSMGPEPEPEPEPDPEPEPEPEPDPNPEPEPEPDTN